jgi:8-oxo-dGTP pyrophosphatase MutT (NUDIX family)
MSEIDAPNIPVPSHRRPSQREFDQDAMAVREALGCRLAAFTAVFDPPLRRVLMVRLGDYARRDLGGNPWSLPGGAVEVDERPSAAAIREVQEETGLQFDVAELQPCAWIRRPYVIHQESQGELLLLFAARIPIPDPPRPNPPETLDAALVDFDLDVWMQTPSIGDGDAALQPLRRHWIYWTEIALERLRNPNRLVCVCTYSSPQEMALPLHRSRDG